MEVNLEQNLLAETVSLSDSAAGQIKAVIEQQENKDLFVRIFVQGGCGGISYGMALDSQQNSEDWETESHGLKVIVDNISLPYVKGATVDFESGSSSGFRVTNPFVDLSQVGGCGCSSEGSGCGGGSCGSGGGCGSGGCC